MTAADTPFVSVVVPHYQDLKGLEICLASLEAQTYPRERFEIVVSDNNSPIGLDAVRAVTGERARLVQQMEKGAGPNRNAAVAAAKGEVLAFIDSDCVAEPGWLAGGVAALARFDLVGGRVKVLVQDAARMTSVEAFETVFAFDFKTYIEKKGFTGAGNMFCRRELFEHVGGFKVGLSEDLEWSRRAVSLGASLGYAPSAVVGHPARVTWDELRRKWRRLNDETFGLMDGQRGQRAKWLARNLLMPASAIAHTPKVLANGDLTLGQKMLALGALYRIRFWRLGDAVNMLMASRPG